MKMDNLYKVVYYVDNTRLEYHCIADNEDLIIENHSPSQKVHWELIETDVANLNID